MLKIIAALLFVTLLVESEASPKLWGSQIITQKTGEITLNLEVPPDIKEPITFTVVGTEKETYNIKIVESKCEIASDDIWSQPCSYTEGTGELVITVNDVEQQNEILIPLPLPAGTNRYISVIFAPNCSYPTPIEDEPIPEQSAPLSRFVLKKEEVSLTFAVLGVNEDGEVELFRNGDSVCKWKGIVFQPPASEPLNNEASTVCKDLEADKGNTMRILKMNFSKPADKRDYYTWQTTKQTTKQTTNHVLSVTVDAKQEGESPELDACKPATDTTATVTTATVTKETTSAAPQTNMIVANLGFIVPLMYLGR